MNPHMYSTALVHFLGSSGGIQSVFELNFGLDIQIFDPILTDLDRSSNVFQCKIQITPEK